jgi:glycine cleavage system H protein
MILAFTLALVALFVIGVWGLLLVGEKSHETATRWLLGLQRVRGFLLHPRLFYHPGHTWVMPEGNGTVRVGIDDFGRRLLDGICKANLPAKGSHLVAGEPAVQLDCGTRKARLVSPVDGVVIAVNRSLAKDGAALERDPYGKGWLFTAAVSDQKFRGLPTGAAAMEWFMRETGRLTVFLHGELGVTLADGGELISKPPAMLSDEQWETLMRTFFHPSGNIKASDEEDR